jgi:hypothetical protein
MKVEIIKSLLIKTSKNINMRKFAVLLLSLALCSGNIAFGQDTLRLFGHKENHAPKPVPDTLHKQTYAPVKVTHSDDIQTLTGPEHHLGFYFGFHPEYSQVAGNDAFGCGGTFALVVNHGLAIGFSGKGFFSEPYNNAPGSDLSYNYSGGYGGFFIEPILFPKYPVHLSFPVILGAGGIAKGVLTNYNYPYDHTDMYVENAEAFFIVEPGAEIELNVARWLRLGFGASYRFCTTFDPSSFDSNPLNGFTAGFSLKFGKF